MSEFSITQHSSGKQLSLFQAVVTTGIWIEFPNSGGVIYRQSAIDNLLNMKFGPHEIKCKFFNNKLKDKDLSGLIDNIEDSADAYLIKFVVCDNEVGMLLQFKDEVSWHMAMSRQYVGKPLVKSNDLKTNCKSISSIDAIYAVCLCRKEYKDD